MIKVGARLGLVLGLGLGFSSDIRLRQDPELRVSHLATTFSLSASIISSNMAKISLSFESHGIGCTPPILRSFKKLEKVMYTVHSNTIYPTKDKDKTEAGYLCTPSPFSLLNVAIYRCTDDVTTW